MIFFAVEYEDEARLVSISSDKLIMHLRSISKMWPFSNIFDLSTHNFSSLSLLDDVGVKKPVTATIVMIDVGITWENDLWSPEIDHRTLLLSLEVLSLVLFFIDWIFFILFAPRSHLLLSKWWNVSHSEAMRRSANIQRILVCCLICDLFISLTRLTM